MLMEIHVIRYHHCNDDEHKDMKKHRAVEEHEPEERCEKGGSNAVGGMERYVRDNGTHFTKELAEWASSKLNSTDQSFQPITPERLQDMMKQMGVSETEICGTMGDLLYTVNHLKVRHYGQAVVKNNMQCLQLAVESFDDPNYECGEVFGCWLLHMDNTHTEIPWDEF